MAARSLEERIEDLQKRQAKLKAQEKSLKARHAQQKRKARTRRLIQIGAEVEKHAGEITDLDAWRRYVQQYARAIARTQPKSDKLPDQP